MHEYENKNNVQLKDLVSFVALTGDFEDTHEGVGIVVDIEEDHDYELLLFTILSDNTIYKTSSQHVEKVIKN